MIEGAFGDFQRIDDILNGHLLIALGVDQGLGGIQDFISARGVVFFFDFSSHFVFFYKPPVGLFFSQIIELWL